MAEEYSPAGKWPRPGVSSSCGPGGFSGPYYLRGDLMAPRREREWVNKCPKDVCKHARCASLAVHNEDIKRRRGTASDASEWFDGLWKTGGVCKRARDAQQGLRRILSSSMHNFHCRCRRSFNAYVTILRKALERLEQRQADASRRLAANWPRSTPQPAK